MTCLIGTLRDWQTLIAGALAIVAAGFGGFFIQRQTAAIQRQTEAVEQREQARLARQHGAARAVMPLALSALSEHAQDCAASLEPLRASAVGQVIPWHGGAKYEPPTLDQSIISALRDVIESANPIIADRVATLTSNVQVLGARLRSIPERLQRDSSSLLLLSNVNGSIVDAAVVFVRTSGLFEYARRVTDEPSDAFPSEKALHEALQIMGFDISIHRELYDSASLRAEAKAF